MAGEREQIRDAGRRRELREYWWRARNGRRWKVRFKKRPFGSSTTAFVVGTAVKCAGSARDAAAIH